jgi:ABC-type thiamine transport system substrate-binding protein
MKHITNLTGISFLILAVISCSDNNARYIDLNTGNRITVVKDSSTGYMLYSETKEPLVVYYDSQTKDTLYGQTGEVINHKVMRTPEGKYYYEIPKPAEVKQKVLTQDEIDRELLKNGDYKKKVEKDGDIKIKHGDTKTKIDGKTGEKKIKKD